MKILNKSNITLNQTFQYGDGKGALKKEIEILPGETSRSLSKDQAERFLRIYPDPLTEVVAGTEDEEVEEPTAEELPKKQKVIPTPSVNKAEDSDDDSDGDFEEPVKKAPNTAGLEAWRAEQARKKAEAAKS